MLTGHSTSFSPWFRFGNHEETLGRDVTPPYLNHDTCLIQFLRRDINHEMIEWTEIEILKLARLRHAMALYQIFAKET